MISEKKKDDKEKNTLAEEFLKTVESKLRKEEHRTWMIKDPEHIDKYKE